MERSVTPPKDKAYEGILAYIADHDLKAGDRLPPERELCEMLDVSRTTLRGAVAQLISRNVIESREGSGTYVKPQRPISTLGKSFDYSEVVRSAGREPGARVLAQEIIGADEALAERLEIDEGSKVFRLRRLRLADGEPTSIELSHIPYYLCPGIERHDFSKTALYDVIYDEYGLDSTFGSERIKIVSLTEEEAGHLGCEPGSPAFLQRGIVYSHEMVPVEYLRSLILSSRYLLAGEFRAGEQR